MFNKQAPQVIPVQGAPGRGLTDMGLEQLFSGLPWLFIRIMGNVITVVWLC